MVDRRVENLVKNTKETYGDSFHTHLLEQYKLYVQSAENVSARRVASMHYLLALNTALVALYGLQAATLGRNLWAILIPFMGIGSSLIWCCIIESYRNLNTSKFKIILELEKYLPVALFDCEWKIVKQGRGNSYRPVTRIELCIPIAFLILHLSIAAFLIIAFVCANVS